MPPDGRRGSTDVLLVAYAPPTGAVAELFGAISENLSSVARVAVLAPSELASGIAVATAVGFPYSTRRPYKAIVGAGWRAHRTAARLRPKTVVLFTQHPLNALAMLHLGRRNLVFWWHEPMRRGQASSVKTWLYRMHDALVAPLSSAIVVAAPSVKRNVPARYRSRTFVVPFPTPTLPLVPSARFDAAPVDLMFFGRLAAYKGLDSLAAALRMLRQQDVRPSVRLIGAGSLSTTAPDMAAYAAEHPEQVDHIGDYVTNADLYSAIVASSAVVLPYLSAAGSSTIAIVGALGRPMIATRCGCFGDYLVDGVSASLVEPGDSEALALEIRRVLDDAELRARLADGALRLVAEQFDPMSSAAELKAVLDQVGSATSAQSGQ